MSDWDAVIFDMDGLMFDTERIAQVAWSKAAAACGYEFSDEIFRGVIGRRLPDVEQYTNQAFGRNFPFQRVYRLKQAYVNAYIDEYGLPAKPGLFELLALLDQLDIKKAVASSSTCNVIHRNLLLSGLMAERFDALVSGHDVQNGKPAPDIFLKASQQLGLNPNACLVLEDSNPGIQAAHAAGMTPVMVPDLIPPDEATRKIAFRILPSLFTVMELLQ